jgi:hypothetical protein
MLFQENLLRRQVRRSEFCHERPAARLVCDRGDHRRTWPHHSKALHPGSFCRISLSVPSRYGIGRRARSPAGVAVSLDPGDFLCGAYAADTAVLITLAASASYIAVPAAMRLALPEANPAIALTLSLGVPFHSIYSLEFRFTSQSITELLIDRARSGLRHGRISPQEATRGHRGSTNDAGDHRATRSGACVSLFGFAVHRRSGHGRLWNSQGQVSHTTMKIPVYGTLKLAHLVSWEHAWPKEQAGHRTSTSWLEEEQ